MRTLKQYALLTLLPLSTISQLSMGQLADLSNRIELRGDASFANTRVGINPSSQFSSFGWFQQIESFSFTPGVGYFLSNNIELLCELRYDWSRWHSGDSRYTAWGENYQIGFLVGISFSYRVTSRLMPFIGLNGGMYWPRRFGTYDPSSDDPPFLGLDEPVYLLPIVRVGSRIFVKDDWNVLISVEYSKMKNDGRIHYWQKANRLRLHIGLSTLL